MARIGIVNVPFYSHVGAATRLAGTLVRQGHTVVAWGPEWSRGWIDGVGARYERHEPPMPKVRGHVAFVASLASTTEEIVDGLIEELFEAELDLVVHDSQVPWARVAAEYLGLPRIVSHPMFPIVTPRRVSFDGEEALPIEDPDDARTTFERSWLAIAQRFGVELGNWDGVIHDTSDDKEATVVFTTEQIVGKALKPGWHCIGPLMPTRPRVTPEPERPLVYACFGTSFNRRTKQFEAVIEGLAGEPVDVLVSTGGGQIRAESFRALPANVVVKDFVDGREVLTRASAHITHGGCNTVHESLLAGVPMLCIPQGYDQFPLTRRVELLGAGRIVEEEPEQIRDGVRWLLGDDAPRSRAQELARHLVDYDSMARVAELIGRVLAGSVAPTIG